MIKLLLTGANGQLGRNLRACLQQDANLLSDVELLAMSRTDLDISNRLAVMQKVVAFKPDFIINTAAYTNVEQAEVEVEQAYLVNRDGAKFLAQAANQCGAVIIHISTDYVFSGECDQAYCESDLTAPLNIYGASKLAGEQAVASACPWHIIIRTSWLFSAKGNNFAKTMLRLANNATKPPSANKSAKICVVDDQLGGPTFVGDLSAAIIKIITSLSLKSSTQESTAFGVYHYSGWPYVSWFTFAETIFACAAQQQLMTNRPNVIPVSAMHYKTQAQRPKNSALAMDKIRAEFAVIPSDWQAALADLKDYMPD